MRHIETPRLRLRQFTPDDSDDLYRIYSHPELFKYMSNEKPLLWEQTKSVIESFTEDWQQHHFGVWAVIYKKNQKLIGHCGLKFLENTSEIQVGYLLLKSYWGKGLGTEAATATLKYGFETAKIEKIVAIAKPENIASRRVMEKVGMKYEKDDYYYDNDVVYYSISRQAYQAQAIRLKNTIENENLSLPIPQLLTPIFNLDSLENMQRA
ncbi:MAG TPA: GNAT family N-acetyltransferase [Coleofasciculaceae cyanobacterium]|jgi:ribosomal-protein-alanine N-acetyltransferase